jgi:hypothetical protein
MEGQVCNVPQQLKGHFYSLYVICISENLTETLHESLHCLGGCAQEGAISVCGNAVATVTSTMYDGLPGGIVLCSPQAADLGARE